MLKDLPLLLEQTKSKIANDLKTVKEFSFSEKFKRLYKEIIPETIFLEHTVIIPKKDKTVVAPSLWFYVGTQLIDLLSELKLYESRVLDIIHGIGQQGILDDFEKWTDDIRKKVRPIPADFLNYSVKNYGEDDTEKIKMFLIDYKSWGGGKAIGRNQNDFTHSPLLNASGLLNESSGYISNITEQLKDRRELIAEILQLVRHKYQSAANISSSVIYEELISSGMRFSQQIITRFVSSLVTKPLVILTGLSGSGKTKLAQIFCQWITEDKNQYRIIPVGADWTNREPLLGFFNGLNSNEYITPDSGALDLIIEAMKQENQNKPFFLILDEMNLSHIERYFADFLSVMESNDFISLYSGSIRTSASGKEIPSKIFWPKNLFIVGTVNIDETTYMFSPKVLDRANTIEFRIDTSEIQSFLTTPPKIDISLIMHGGESMAEAFLQLSSNVETENQIEVTKVFMAFFEELKKVGAEFGYRAAAEMLLLIKNLKRLDEEVKEDECIDIAVMQKLLPKLHGSRKKLGPVLKHLGVLCLKEEYATEAFFDNMQEIEYETVAKYPISLEKINRMYRNLIDNGFTSYAEA